MRMILLCLVLFCGLEAKEHRYHGIRVELPDKWETSRSHEFFSASNGEDVRMQVRVKKKAPSFALMNQAVGDFKARKVFQRTVHRRAILNYVRVAALETKGFRVMSKNKNGMMNLTYYIPAKGHKAIIIDIEHGLEIAEGKKIADSIVSMLSYVKKCKCVF